MPVEPCSSNGKPGYKFGDSGTCYTYTPGDSSSRKAARDKANMQERAARASGWTEKSDLSNTVLQFIEYEMSSYEEFLNKELPPLAPAEQIFADTLVAIARRYGKLQDGDETGIWIGYIEPEDNDDKDIGVKCSNCYFYESEKVCSIISREIHPDAMCRLAAIPPGLVVSNDMEDEDDDMDDDESDSEDLIRVTYGRPGPNDPRKTPAPSKDRRRGSSRNPSGSAQSGRSISFSSEVNSGLRAKMQEHNKKNPESSKKATMAALKAVYRRGAGAFSTSHRPGMTRGQWAMARVNAYLYLLRNGRPSNPNYTTDNDLLPKGHPRSSK